MTKYVEFPLEGGGSILIESNDEKKASGSGFVRAGAGEAASEMLEKAHQSLDQSFENVRKSADLLVQKLHGLSQPPDEMEVNFSLKVSGELGNVAIGKASADANYMVTLKWRREDKKDDKKEEKKDEPKAD